jgi:hypothetical protein
MIDANLKKFSLVQMWPLALAFLVGVISVSIGRCLETRKACNCNVSSPEAFEWAKQLHEMRLQEIQQQQKLETQRGRQAQQDIRRQNERLAALKQKGIHVLRQILDDA